MNYLNLEEIEQSLKSLPRVDMPLPEAKSYIIDNVFAPIIISNFRIVIGTAHSKYPSIFQYEQLYFYIEEFFSKDSLFGLISPAKDNRFFYFAWAKYFKYNSLKQQGSTSYIGARVPPIELCQIVKDVYKVSTLRTFF